MNVKPSSRTRAPEVRRESLMDSALQVFIEHGIGAATVDQITARALVAKGTFYWYFKSKDEVVDALIGRFADQLLEKIDRAVGKVEATDWNGKLASWARACVDGYLEAMRSHDALFYGNRPSSRRAKVDNVVVKGLEGLLLQGAAAGAWMIDDVPMTAEFLHSGLHGAVDRACSSEKRVVKSKLIAKIEAMVVHALKG